MTATEGKLSDESQADHGGSSRTQGMARSTTLLELVTEVSQDAQSEAELISKVVYLVNSGIVRLCGNFKGERFDPRSFAGLCPAA